jgi:Chain length determinant protein
VHELYVQFLHLLNAVWHRRWAALGASWLVALLGWALVVALPNTYTSSARIFIDATSIMKPVLEGLAIDWDLNLDPEVMKQTLTTRANLERVARMTDLDLTATTPAAMERLLNSLRSRTSFVNEGEYLLRLSFTDPDPARAQQVAQALTDVFLDANLGHSREQMENAQAFLDRQIADYERQLGDAEQRLATFRQERLSTLPSEENYEFQTEQLRDELAEAEASLARTQALQTRLRGELNAGPTSDTALQIFETEQAVEQLLINYTERHPDVIALRRKLAGLRGDAGTRWTAKLRANARTGAERGHPCPWSTTSRSSHSSAKPTLRRRCTAAGSTACAPGSPEWRSARPRFPASKSSSPGSRATTTCSRSSTASCSPAGSRPSSRRRAKPAPTGSVPDRRSAARAGGCGRAVAQRSHIACPARRPRLWGVVRLRPGPHQRVLLRPRAAAAGLQFACPGHGLSGAVGGTAHLAHGRGVDLRRRLRFVRDGLRYVPADRRAHRVARARARRADQRIPRRHAQLAGRKPRPCTDQLRLGSSPMPLGPGRSWNARSPR